jgi:hypothetical protein
MQIALSAYRDQQSHLPGDGISGGAQELGQHNVVSHLQCQLMSS